MANRTLATYEEKRLDTGPHWTLTVDRSAGGAPGLFFTIRTQTFDPEDRDIASLNQEMTVVVEDGNEFLKPVIEWLQDHTPTKKQE